MGIEDRLESTRDRVEDTEREIERLKDRAKNLETMLSRIAKERHDAAVEAGGFMRGHNIDFNVCMESVCVLAVGE